MFAERTILLFSEHPSLQTIENYLANSPKLRCTVPDVINPDDFKRLFGSLIKGRTVESRKLLVGLTRLKNWYGILTRTIEAKLIFGIEATVDILNRNNYLVLAMCARSLMEHAASIIYLHARCEKAQKNFGKCKNQHELIDRVTELNSFCEKFMFGTKFFGNENREALGLHDAFHIMDMLREGNEHASGMLRNYDFLCDLVHPNFLSNILVFQADVEDWSWKEEQKFQNDMSLAILNTINVTLSYLEYNTTKLFWNFLHDCDHYFRKLLQPDSAIQSLFVEPRLVYSGDGLSRKSAVTFPVVSMKEHFQMLEKFIVKEKLFGAGIQIHTTESAKFNFSLLEFSEKKIWFKVSKELEFHRKLTK